MNTENENTDMPETPAEGVPTDRRPLGYWLRTVDALLTSEFASAFDGEDVTRRDWMLLSLLSGDVDRPGFAERLARKGKKLRSLEERGWVVESGDGTWTLTDEGRAAKERLGGIVDGLRARVAGAVSADDYATTMASLEAIARELGWSEDMRMPRGGFGRRGFGPGFRPGFGPGHGFGPGFGRGFGPGHGFGPGFGPGRGYERDADAAHEAGDRGHGFGPRHGHGCAPHGERAAHGEHRGHHGHHRDGGKRAERAYERGFEAGFARGNASQGA